MAAKINVLFPVEIINRELDFRLWLAVLYAHKNSRIFIGQHDELFYMSKKLNGGLYVGKNLFQTAFPVDMTRYRSLKAGGFKLVHLDEEGLAAGFDEASFIKYLHWRLDASILSADDYVCTWGDAQREVYARAHVKPENVRTTGHPRFDLYDKEHRAYYDGEAKALRARFGKFILFNTNLSHANNGLGVADTFNNPTWYDHRDPDARRNHFVGWTHQSHLLCNMVKCVNAMAMRWPDTTIVVRPHPSEDWSYYESVFFGLKNVHVIHEGPVGPWLFACSVLVHHACTTAIEAHLADVPVIDYKSFEDEVLWRDENRVPERFGALVTKESEVLDLIANLDSSGEALTANRLTPDTRAILNNFERDGSFQRLIDVMKEAESTLPSGAGGELPGLRTARAVRVGKLRAKKVVRPLLPAKMHAYQFFRNCFYGFEPAAIARKLETIQRLTGKKVTWELLGDDLLCVEAS